jgi:hypothetical protein
MTVHYLSAAGQEDLVAEAVCTRRGRNLNYVHVDADEHHAVMEIAAELADEDAGREHVVVDHFIVDDGGLVTRMAVYLRPDEVDATRARLAQS